MREKAVSFIFDSDKAGKASIAFRLASQYLKEDSSWTPIWMGDVQFNKVAKVYVNGSEYQVPDEVILPGGGSQGGEPNPCLWFNWVEVALNDINLKADENTIMIQFLKHGINDCSQSTFNNNFCANLDSLKVISGECKVAKYNDINSVSINIAEVVEAADGYEIKFTGKIDYSTIDEAKALEILESDLFLNIGEDIDVEVVLNGFEFEAVGALPESVMFAKQKELSVKFGLDNLATLKINVTTNVFYEEGIYSWSIENNGTMSAVVIKTVMCDDINIEYNEDDTSIAIDGTDVKLENRDGT